MKIKLVSGLTSLTLPLVRQLQERGFEDVEVDPEGTDWFELRYGNGVHAARLAELMEALHPFSPPLKTVADLDGRDVEIHLGDALSFKRSSVRIWVDSEEMLASMREAIGDLGVANAGDCLDAQDRSYLVHRDAPPQVRQALRWLALRQGVSVAEQPGGAEAGCVDLFLKDPSQEGVPPEQRFPIEVFVDDPGLGEVIREKVEGAGFAKVTVLPLDSTVALKAPLSIVPGPFEGAAAVARLHAVLNEVVRELEIDTSRFPLRIIPFPQGSGAQVILPIGACRAGYKMSYAGPYPERFQVAIVTDDLDRAEGLVQRLRASGFTEVNVRKLSGVPKEGFSLQWGEAADEPAIARVVKDAVRAEMETLAAGGEQFELGTSRLSEEENPEITITFPAKAAEDGRLTAAILDVQDFECTMYVEDEEKYREVIENLRGWGFKSFSVSPILERDVRVRYGGASPELIDAVVERVEALTGHALAREKAWGDGDDDIWISLPGEDEKREPGDVEPVDPFVDLPDETSESEDVGGGGEESTVGAGLTAWLEEEAPGDPASLLEVTADTVRIGQIVLPRRAGERHRLAPRPEAFSHYCLDETTVHTIVHVATSVALAEPCLLEGETSTSKTSSILFLASLLNHPVVRLNLNGQTDTGELVGRYVPEHLSAILPFGAEELLAAEDLLEPETRMILARANSEGRNLSPIEVQQVVANERIRTRPWRWSDGLVVRAMRRGWWVILDEVNLAEPQILERLNSVLELQPQLVLTEHDGSVIGPGGEAVHPDFRIFATMNPAEYAGRSVLSPAYRNRWRAFRAVPRQDEAGYLAMLRFLVHGEQPDVTVRGRSYSGGAVAAPFAALADVEGIDGALVSLARFHSALEHASGSAIGSQARIGVRRKERYVFTRRDLLSVVEYLASPLSRGESWPGGRGLREALLRYYLERVTGDEDRQLVVMLLDAAGIGPNTWAPGSSEEASVDPAEEVPGQPRRLLLEDVGRDRVAVETALRDLLPLAEAMEALESAPSEVGEGLAPEELQALKERLEAAGATVKLL